MSGAEWREARQRQPVFAGLAAGFKPRKRISLSEYAEENLVLRRNVASYGPYRVGDATYQRGMMDAVTHPDNHLIVMVTSSQVGKTTVLTAAQLYYAHHEPSPQLSVFPTQIAADGYVEEQFEPTLLESTTPAAVFDGLTYPGGFIAFVGANNPTQLASRPIRAVTGDEVDRWPISSGKEGSPIDLIGKRMTTFRNRKAIYASTPVHVKTSQIVALFKKTKQFYYLVVCPDCGHMQVLKWDGVHFEKNKEAEAVYHCEECGSIWNEAMKRKLVRDAPKMGGGWTHLQKAPFKCFQSDIDPEDGAVGFYINEIYSPWSSLREMAKAWTEAEGNPENEQTFINTRLGLPWDGNVSDFADAEKLKTRREVYSPKMVPAKAGLVTAAVDIQDDRAEVLTVAWGLGDESWILEHIVIQQDPSVSATWRYIKEVLSRKYPHESGKRLLGVEVAAIDSGGHFTQQAYAWAAAWQKEGLRWHAIKGVPGEGKPIWQLSDAMKRKGTRLALIGTHDAKTTIYTRYAIETPGPGYIHIHEGISDDLIKQMTSEHVEVEYDTHGFPQRKWDKPRSQRNEGLDLMVYNLAARSSYKIDMATRLAALNEAAEQGLDPAKIGELFK